MERRSLRDTLACEVGCQKDSLDISVTDLLISNMYVWRVRVRGGHLRVKPQIQRIFARYRKFDRRNYFKPL